MSKPRIVEAMDTAVDDLMTVLRWLPVALDTLEDRKEGYGTGRRYDATGSTVRSVIWCHIHDRDLNDECRAELCVGEPVEVPSDPTGDRAADLADGHIDPAQAEEDEISRLVRNIRRDADTLLAKVVALQPHEPNTVEQKRADQENERNRLNIHACCEVCLKAENSDGSHKKEPMHPGVKGATDVGGRLAKPHRLCRRHYEFVAKVGRLPDEDEERVFQQGKAPKVKQLQTSRLVAGLANGHLVP